MAAREGGDVRTGMPIRCQSWHSDNPCQYDSASAASPAGARFCNGPPATPRVRSGHGDYHIPLLVPLFNISVGIGNRLQRIAPVYD